MRKIVLGLFFLLLAGIFPALAQEKTISGKVSSMSDGSPLPAVTVAIKGTNKAAQTDASGNYSIRAAVGQTLQFSSVGFLSKEVKIGSGSRIDISLESDNKQLGEVVVTAFGQAKEKKALGYSIQQVGGEEIAQTGRTNFINSLQGRVAGLDIVPPVVCLDLPAPSYFVEEHRLTGTINRFSLLMVYLWIILLFRRAAC